MYFEPNERRKSPLDVLYDAVNTEAIIVIVIVVIQIKISSKSKRNRVRKKERKPNLLEICVRLDKNVNLEASSDLGGNSQARFEINVEFMQVFLRIEAFYLLPVERIGQIEMRERHKSGSAISARGRVNDSGRIADSARTEAPIISVVGSVSEHALSSGVPIRRESVILDIFLIV